MKKIISFQTLLPRITGFFFFALFFTSASVSHASGYNIPGGLSIAGLGTADALVANPEEVGALAYNPAAMSFHKERILVLGLMAIWPDSKVTPEGENNSISDDPDEPIIVPNLYLMSPVLDNWTIGLGVNAPFGLETNWQAGTFPAFEGPLAPLEPAKSRLEMFNLNPNISYRINEHASLAAGLDYYRVNDAITDTQGLDLNGDGSDFGWNAAFMYVFEQWSLGLSYQSAVKVKINGEFDATKVLGFKVNSKTEIEFPSILRLGVRYRFNDKLAVEFNFNRTEWSTFDETVIKSKDNIPAAGISSGDVLGITTNNWNDTNSYHIGTTYQLMPATQLRLGYALNENPQPESYYSPRYPSSKIHQFSAGIKQEIKGWDLEGGIMYVRLADRTINNSQPYLGGDANGTVAYNGKYDIDGLLAGIGLNYYF